MTPFDGLGAATEHVLEDVIEEHRVAQATQMIPEQTRPMTIAPKPLT